jgi:PKD repeat protein
LWDFGDGAISTSQDPAKKFNLPGNYIVRLEDETTVIGGRILTKQ